MSNNLMWILLTAVPVILGLGVAYVMRRKPRLKEPLLWAIAGMVVFKLFETAVRLVVETEF